MYYQRQQRNEVLGRIIDMTGTAADLGIIWSDDFLIGIEELDYEHRCLIDDVNELHRELLEHVDTTRIKDTLSRILTRMQAHFALEEHVMVAHKYPYYSQHKVEHESLLDDYTDLISRFEGEMKLGDQENIESVLRHWIVDHIRTSDKKMSLMIESGR